MRLPAPDAEQRNKISARLRLHAHDRADHGQVLPLTAAALALGEGADQGAARLEALVSALREERVVVPVVVGLAADLGAGGVPEVGSQKHDPVEFVRCGTPFGPALVVYSSQGSLLADRSQDRPIAFDFHKVCLAALVETGGRVCMDPGGAAVVLPRPAVAACAQGDDWLPAWRDLELLAELRELAGVRAVRATRVEVAGASADAGTGADVGAVAPGGPVADVRVVHAGGVLVRVEVLLDAARLVDSGRAEVEETLRRIATSPRLRAAVDEVELRPLVLP
ncbi:SseB family protein [Schaalia sp. 19OD2882]|uniref:SseB family protein n=1 Tax=Schaalia sp. 19OD2882 TaxID=2794089 RepID=UPI001C1EC963|nr:SseB family protein [Schaalia sp. 19OD2882]QWW18922.1 SseB family protein [Schaalia sp. 19OD2882]